MASSAKDGEEPDGKGDGEKEDKREVSPSHGENEQQEEAKAAVKHSTGEEDEEKEQIKDGSPEGEDRSSGGAGEEEKTATDGRDDMTEVTCEEEEEEETKAEVTVHRSCCEELLIRPSNISTFIHRRRPLAGRSDETSALRRCSHQEVRDSEERRGPQEGEPRR